ncbi:AAA family ATPase [Chitinophaga caeni]|uniref:AAA family ATPase n=1 Tax=Chitinophaga caeni TaxID=2029983 RepID=A0A291QWN3_9BACT|nr:ATP-binding protein [Chitinophaga caeni]ATL48368.1 AAA family ATPase [Chitinophaga caeni]
MSKIEILPSLHRVIDCLRYVIKQRMDHYLGRETAPKASPEFILPLQSPLGEFIARHQLNQQEITVLFLALIPHIYPSFYDEIFASYIDSPTDFPQLGGVRAKSGRNFLPTGQTALFILAGQELDKRIKFQHVFNPQHLFSKERILWLEDVAEGEPFLNGKMILAAELSSYFINGKLPLPNLSINFPAQHLDTQLDWDSLVLPEETKLQIEEIIRWVDHHDYFQSQWDAEQHFKPGYRSLFYGPPGTGKTFTATLLGKKTNKPVFRIDLSMVISKYIGETEKNLSSLFNQAERKDWILFFDEGDALFSKRTNVRDAHDKYANQEAAYLLQRIEQFNGLVILATNFKNNIDEAFTRRFHSIIHFPAPGNAERMQIWEKVLPGKAPKSGEIDLTSLAKKYELTGSGIMNAVQHACFLALATNSRAITQEMLLAGIKREYGKEGKIW